MDADRMLWVLDEIASDMKNDAANFDGQPFNGRTVAEYFGNQGAAISALAGVLKVIGAERAAEQLESLTPKEPMLAGVQEPTEPKP